MKKFSVLVGLLGVFCAPVLHAAVVFDGQVQITQASFSSGNGGEFNVTASGGLAWMGSFPTFCLETAEYFVPGGTYDAIVNNAAAYGGVGPAGDPICIGTAWLYSQFRAGTLSGYDASGAARLADAGVLRQTIWYLEGEQSVLSDHRFYDLIPSDPSFTVSRLRNLKNRQRWGVFGGVDFPEAKCSAKFCTTP